MTKIPTKNETIDKGCIYFKNGKYDIENKKLIKYEKSDFIFEKFEINFDPLYCEKEN